MAATALYDNSGKNNLILPILKPCTILFGIDTLCYYADDQCMDLRLMNKQKNLKGRRLDHYPLSASRLKVLGLIHHTEFTILKITYDVRKRHI